MDIKEKIAEDRANRLMVHAHGRYDIKGVELTISDNNAHISISGGGEHAKIVLTGTGDHFVGSAILNDKRFFKLLWRLVVLKYLEPTKEIEIEYKEDYRSELS